MFNSRNSLFKYLAMSQKNQDADPQNEQPKFLHTSRNDHKKSVDRIAQMSSPANTVKPVKYGVSPAKVAQVERQCSSESEATSNSSDEDQPSTERSRPLIRGASPRRSASPMRRIQIGKSGSRRATALTIKSLSYFPARERVPSNRDAAGNSSEEEEFDQPQKRPESNLRRMSVQDAINLFESKQRDQNSDLQKKSSTDISVTTNKSVLRRWSTGMGNSSIQCPPENASEGTVQASTNNLVVGEIQKTSMDLKAESNFIAGSLDPVNAAEVGTPSETGEIRASYSTENPEDKVVDIAEETLDRGTASAEWNRQKEAELNQMLMKMMESKPLRYQNKATGNSRSQEFPTEQRGGFYDHYKEKRDEKLRGENAGKQRTEKEPKFKAMLEVLDRRKAEMASKNVGVTGKNNSLGKPRKSQKNSSPSMQPKKETSKPAISRKALPKASTLPTTRKSWPSTPSTKTTGTTPTKAITSAGTTPTRRKPQPTPSPIRSTQKLERSQQQQKNVKGIKTENKRNLKVSEEKKQQPVIRSGKTTKAKVLPTSGDDTGTVPAKPNFYSKVTKKSSSVVPLESKPFLRKGSRIGPGVGPVVIKAKASLSDDSLKNSGNLIQAQEDVVARTSEPATKQEEGDMIPQVSNDADLEAEGSVRGHNKYEKTEKCDQIVAEGDGSFQKNTDLQADIQVVEESAISPIAWVEIEDQQELLPVSHDSSLPQIAFPTHVTQVALSGPRVRHSLSQMLQEESGEPEIIEWGNAENPPAMVYQKDTPKGLKRLLKFARKSRGEANVTGWSSPSVFSEGEEDAEESKAASKRNADTLLRKAALQTKGFGQQKTSFGEIYDGGNLPGHDVLSGIIDTMLPLSISLLCSTKLDGPFLVPKQLPSFIFHGIFL